MESNGDSAISFTPYWNFTKKNPLVLPLTHLHTPKSHRKWKKKNKQKTKHKTQKNYFPTHLYLYTFMLQCEDKWTVKMVMSFILDHNKL